MVMVTTAGVAPAAVTSERLAAMSNTAMSITGDVVLSPTQITFQNGISLRIRRIGSGVVDDMMGQSVPADIFAVARPGNPTLLNGNKLCGPAAPKYLAISRPAPGRDTRSIMVYDSGSPLAGASACAAFNYVAQAPR
jgi:hypothetical protein